MTSIAKSGQIQRAAPEPPAGGGLVRFTESIKGELARCLPKHVQADRVARCALTALHRTPGLANCTPVSFGIALLNAAAIGLEPDTALGEAYLVPFRTTCQLIVGYQGLMKLARQSGYVTSIQGFPRMQGDEFHYELGLNPTLTHIPNEDVDRNDASALIGAYARASVKPTLTSSSTETMFEYVTKKQIEAARKSGASGFGIKTPWDTHYVAMAVKTAVRRLCRWLPRSAELAMAIELDEAHERAAAQPAMQPEETARLLHAGGYEWTVEQIEKGEPPIGPEPAPEVQ